MYKRQVMKNKQEESDLWSEERRFWESGCTCICGADEAGAGPLAGPVYAAAVILPPGRLIPGLNDSKKLTARQREILFDQICAEAQAYAVASVDEQTIDAVSYTHLAPAEEVPEGVIMEQCVLGISYTTPVSGWLSSPFGYREHPIEGEEKFHRGLDIAAPAGTDIGAFADGTVKAVGERCV